ncbi:MAG TPA: hypothetical protein DCR77_12170 [Flavobacteriaceae bacterium]|nr:hypothetical protein [Flavobacteriaceae bacterium]
MWRTTCKTIFNCRKFNFFYLFKTFFFVKFFVLFSFNFWIIMRVNKDRIECKVITLMMNNIFLLIRKIL